MSAFGGGGDDPFADILGDSMQKYSTEAKSTPLRRATMSGPQISNSAVGSKSFSPRRASAGASSRPDIRRPPRKAADALRNGQKPALPNSPPPPLPKSQPPSGPPGGAPVQTIGQIANPPGTKRANVNDFMRPPGSVAPRPGSRPSPGFKESLGVNPFLKIKSAHHKQKSSLLDDIDFTSPEAMLAKPVQPMRNDPYSDPSHVKTDGGVPRSRSDRVGFGPRSGRRTRGKEKEEKHQQSATTGLSPSLPPPPSSSSFSSSSSLPPAATIGAAAEKAEKGGSGRDAGASVERLGGSDAGIDADAKAGGCEKWAVGAQTAAEEAARCCQIRPSFGGEAHLANPEAEVAHSPVRAGFSGTQQGRYPHGIRGVWVQRKCCEEEAKSQQARVRSCFQSQTGLGGS
mmetsp:Transcript_6591/g.16061  ORF Transcript_6591/g.16061 Transcript_6591/m.16061 type:complete len:400 (+) Transcript_6591:201-1400(+)